MSMRFPFVLMLSALGCAAPALAEPSKSGDDAPAQPPAEGEPGEGAAPGQEEEPPAHEEPEAAPEEPGAEDGAEEPGADEPGAEEPGAEEPEPPPDKEKPEPEPVKPPAVKLSEPEFINGDVPAVTNILNKTLSKVAQCVADHGGLEVAEGGMKVQFLVRARGRAEGVEVLERHGVSKDAARCVQKLLKNKWVGMPSVDPTGVVFRYDMNKKG